VRSDSELILQLQQHDQQAFAELYNKYKLSIYRYCMSMVGESALAEDAVQETFLKLHAHVDQLLQVDKLLGWLLSIARNEVLMHIRRNRRNGQMNEEILWADDSPHDLVVKIETQEIVRSLLGQLRQEYREVMMLREYEHLSYGEIAAITGDTESSVKSRLFKARKALTEKLKSYYS
jgi:RNA polymerase sigma-70 factor, ECF subfamily